MKRIVKIILFISISILLLFAIIFLVRFFTSSVEKCLKESPKSILCAQMLVDKEISTYDICYDIQDIKGRGACIFIAAKRQSNHSLCEKIDDEYHKLNCEIVLSNSPDNCKDLLKFGGESYVNICIRDIAELTKNVSLCDKFSGFDLTSCYSGVALFNRDKNICNSLAGDLRDSCISKYEINIKLLG